VTPLETAAAALAGGDRAGALHALLDAWRHYRAPRIASLVDLVSTELVAASEPLGGTTETAVTAAFLEVADRHDPIDLGRLLVHPWPGHAGSARAWRRALATWPDDPRLAMALARYLASGHCTSPRAVSAVVAQLSALDDLRTVPLVAHARTGRYRVRIEGPPPALAELATADEAALHAIEERYRAEVAAVAKVTDRGAALQAAVLAEPDDRGPKAVLGDWLLERGDPRGELVAIQLASRDGWPKTLAHVARERELVRKHGREWAGVPAP
jgi:uncharacterized protein (TIGR02996 family)